MKYNTLRNLIMNSECVGVIIYRSRKSKKRSIPICEVNDKYDMKDWYLLESSYYEYRTKERDGKKYMEIFLQP